MSELSDIKKWLKEDGKYEYSWNHAVGGDDPTKTERDKSLLNRKEGYEVAPFIRRVLHDNNWLINKKNTLILENDIHTHCTSRSKKEIETCIAARHAR